MYFFGFVYLWRIFFPQVSIRIVTAMFRATQSSISELFFFSFKFFPFLLKHCYHYLFLCSYRVNLLLDINRSYLDMIMFNSINKSFCRESSSQVKRPDSCTYVIVHWPSGTSNSFLRTTGKEPLAE